MLIKGNKQQVYEKLAEYLESKKDDKIFYCYFSNKMNKEIRSLQQNKLFWKLFISIGNHLGETKEDTRTYLLSAIFGTHILQLGKTSLEVPNESKTSLLDKEKGTHFIKTIIEFCKVKDIPLTITGNEIESLYNSY